MQQQSADQQKTQNPQYITGLMVNNSLQPGKLVEFIPENGRQIKMYNCGPTVYDASHMGHARTYVSVDMIKKILSRYLKYDVLFVMNITDIDDKIINRSNELQEDFTTFARKWEKDYFEDMKNLNVELPDVLVRVSEYVPEIIKFIEQIIQKGYAYESNGSVYFNVQQFIQKSHNYAKLEPNAGKDLDKLREGEGSSQCGKESEKKNEQDFVLWKNSKPNEPKWQSPWGEGRPGWHIECSTMADHILGSPIDIHMGGIDLKFPHHDNEIAQTEAYYDCDQWIKYFIHTGHIHIDGLKMSKSLKNFITIKALLKKYNQRHMRLLFAMHKYDTLMEYYPPIQTEDGKITDHRSMGPAVDRDARFSSFFKNARGYLQRYPIQNLQKWVQDDFVLHGVLEKVQAKIHKSFLDNFNTSEVINTLDELITATNTYFKGDAIKFPLLKKVYDYAIYIFEVMGIQYEVQKTEENQEFANLINQICDFRDKVRNLNKTKQNNDEIIQLTNQVITSVEEQKGDTDLDQAQNIFRQYAQDIIQVITSNSDNKDEIFKQILQLSDKLRDEQMVSIGIRVDDRNNQPSLWKQENKDTLQKEINQKKGEKLEEQKKKDEEKKKKEKERQEQMKIDPKKLFVQQNKTIEVTKYSQFDENGIPTHEFSKHDKLTGALTNEKALTEKDRKKLTQLWEEQVKLHHEFLSKKQNGKEKSQTEQQDQQQQQKEQNTENK